MPELKQNEANIDVIIDAQGGFALLGLDAKRGGLLYVPGGEQIDAVIASTLENKRNSTIVLSQDFHPANHISFMINHPGIMEYRIKKFREFLIANKQPIPSGQDELAFAAQQPAHFFHGYENAPTLFPFEEIVLDVDGNIIGLKEGDKVRKVELDVAKPTPNCIGRVKKVTDEYFEPNFDDIPGARTQTLWTQHCQQNTESSMFLPQISSKLPQALLDLARRDSMSKDLEYFDETTGNTYYIVRKGINSERDSYGIGLENDKETETTAREVFGKIAKNLARQGVKKVNFNCSGLATNFCVEFSVNNIHDIVTGLFRYRGMETEVRLITDGCRGIPIPGGKDNPFSLEGAPLRMAEYREGTKLITAEEYIKLNTTPGVETSGELAAAGTARTQAVA